MSKRLVVETHASSCYFRTSVDDGARKALVQITERCNLRCVHCFVSSTQVGVDIALEEMVEVILPRLRRAQVTRLTLTGGGPFVHPQLIEICTAAARMDMPTKICTNATRTSDAQIAALAELGNVRVIVSFDGFRPGSHGRFRGNRDSFTITRETTRKFADAGLLCGILSTPNMLTRSEDFAELCAFAADLGAAYVLMNDTRPLSGCDAGTLIYVFADGGVAVCPCLVFVARTPQSRHADREFLVGNIFDGEIADTPDRYRFDDRYQVGVNSSCARAS